MLRSLCFRARTLCVADVNVVDISMEPCRFDTGCWRPVCPYGHSGRGRAARWAALWSLLAKQEVEDDLEVVKVIPVEAGSERFAEQNAGVPVPPVVVEVEIIPKEHISERKFVEDVPVPPDSGAHLGTYCRTDCRCANASDPGRDRRGDFGPT